MTLQSHGNTSCDTSTTNKVKTISGTRWVMGAIYATCEAYAVISIDGAVWSVITTAIIAEGNDKKIHWFASCYIVIRRATPLPHTKTVQSTVQFVWQIGTKPMHLSELAAPIKHVQSEMRSQFSWEMGKIKKSIKSSLENDWVLRAPTLKLKCE